MLRRLTGNESQDDVFTPAYTMVKSFYKQQFYQFLYISAELGIKWFDTSGMLLNEGKFGLMEGLHNIIGFDGIRKISETVRCDCTGETGFAYYQHYRQTGSRRNLMIADTIEDFILGILQINVRF